MGDNRSYKIIAIVALMIGVVGVTLGYAAMERTLTINPAAEVNPSGLTFNVLFSDSNLSQSANPVAPQLSAPANGFSATNGTITNGSAPTISGMTATFTEAGQSVTYTFYAHNDSAYVAYLKSIIFTGTQSCTAGENTTQSMVTEACSDIVMNVQVHDLAATSVSVPTISGHGLSAGEFEEIVLTITYAPNGTATLVDGDFTVTLPSVALKYATADA